MPPLAATLTLAGAEACLALFFGVVFRGLARAYPRHDVRRWAQAWGWLLAHVVAAVTDGVVAGLEDGGRPWRVLTLTALVATSNLGLLTLADGLSGFVGRQAGRETMRGARVLAAAVAALVGAGVGGGFAPDGWEQALSEGTRAVIATSLAAVTAATALTARRWSGPGSGLTKGGLVGLTLAQGNYAVLAFVLDSETRLAWLPYLSVADWLVWVVLGIGAMTWLLHGERTAAIEETRARQVLEHDLAAREQRFAAIIHGITERIFIVDATGRVTYSAPRPLLVDAYTPADIEDQPFESFLHPDDLDAGRQVFARILASPGVVVSVTLRVRARAGGWLVFDFQGRNLLDDPGVRGVLVTARDVTERVRLQAQLHDAQRMESIGRLAGGVAHDFNNLLTVIAGNAEFGRGQLTPEAPAYTELVQIEAAAARAATLTRQLLSFARRQIVEPRTLELAAVVEGLGDMIRRLAGGHILVTLTAGETRPLVLADRGQLEQVLLNLVANARDAMPDGGRLTIATGRVTVADEAPVPGMAAGVYATVSVGDTGTGIPDEVKAHVFEPFFTTKGVGAGTGLGLASCYGVVSQHGGCIGIETGVGRGSTFTVYLPEATAASAPAVAPEAAAPVRGRERVLLVEDEAAVRRVAAHALRTRGFEVVEAGDGVEAWTWLQGHRADCIVSDVAMPRGSGPALVAQVRQVQPQLPVLLTSGYLDLPALSALLDGVTAFLPKPYSGEELAGKVRRLLDGDGRVLAGQHAGAEPIAPH